MEKDWKNHRDATEMGRTPKTGISVGIRTLIQDGLGMFVYADEKYEKRRDD